MAEFYLVRHGQASFGSDNYDQLSHWGTSRPVGWEYFAERDMVRWLIMIWFGIRKPVPGSARGRRAVACGYSAA